MDWIYNSRTGAVQQLPSPVATALLSTGTGWHGPFDTREEALAFYVNGKAANPGWREPTGVTGNIGNIPGAIVQQNEAAITGAASGIAGGLGLSDEEIRSWLIRIGEILLGIVLIAVGVAKLTGTTNAIASIVKARIP